MLDSLVRNRGSKQEPKRREKGPWTLIHYKNTSGVFLFIKTNTHLKPLYTYVQLVQKRFHKKSLIMVVKKIEWKKYN